MAVNMVAQKVQEIASREIAQCELKLSGLERDIVTKAYAYREDYTPFLITRDKYRHVKARQEDLARQVENAQARVVHLVRHQDPDYDVAMAAHGEAVEEVKVLRKWLDELTPLSERTSRAYDKSRENMRESDEPLRAAIGDVSELGQRQEAWRVVRDHWADFDVRRGALQMHPNSLVRILAKQAYEDAKAQLDT